MYGREVARGEALLPRAIEGALAMAEVRLVCFAQAAMEIATASIPAYGSKFSKRLYTQPQLLAVLCLMRYEDWTFREAEVRLREHTELRDALGMSRVPGLSLTPAEAGV